MKKGRSVVIGLAVAGIALLAACAVLLAVNQRLRAENAQLRRDAFGARLAADLATLREQSKTLPDRNADDNAADADRLDTAADQLDDADRLDREYAAASLEWQTTADMVDGNVEFADRWKAMMEQYLRRLHEQLDPEHQPWLAASQEQWEAFANANSELHRRVYVQTYGQGTMRQIDMAGSHVGRYRTRTMELKSLYETMTSCP